MNTIYCDNAATTPMYSDVIKKMSNLMLSTYGNPSSIHKLGQESKAVIERARLSIADLLMCDVSELIFTGCGSESNNIALLGTLNKGDHLITSSYEHPAIETISKSFLNKGVEVSYITPNADGIIETKKIKNSIKSNTKLISIMYVNNELGTENPIDKIASLAKENNLIFHTDAVQAIGKTKISLRSSNIDMLSLSAHKFGGPKGVGALYVKDAINIKATYYGGGQEKNLRPGTENIVGIYGMSLALDKAINGLPDWIEKVSELENIFLDQLNNNDVQYTINGKNRIPGFINITFRNISSQDLVIGLDVKGFAISGGSACSSGSVSPSKVLKEIGLSDNIAKKTVRISFGKYLSADNVKNLANEISSLINKSG